MLIGLAAPLVANAGTITVGPTAGPGIDFTTIQGAIDAAVEDDLIVVVGGGYQEHLLIHGKSLTLVGQSNPTIFLNEDTAASAPNFTIENLGPNQEVHLINFNLARFGGPSAESIFINRNEGRVWLEEIIVDTYNGHGMRVTNSQNVVLSQVSLQSNLAHTDSFGAHHPSVGLIVEDGSSVDAFQSQATGSHGHPLFGTTTFPIPGGDGVVVIDSSLRLTACSMLAGTGGTLFTGSCSMGAEAGSALVIRSQGGATPQVTSRGSTITGSGPGHFDPGCGPTPPIPPTIDDPLGILALLPGKARTLAMPGLPTPLGALEFQVQGAAGDLWFLYVGLEKANALPISGLTGNLFISPATSFSVLSGTLDQAGFGGLAVTFPNPGFPILLHTQALFVDTAGGFWVSGPSTMASI